MPGSSSMATVYLFDRCGDPDPEPQIDGLLLESIELRHWASNVDARLALTAPSNVEVTGPCRRTEMLGTSNPIEDSVSAAAEASASYAVPHPSETAP